MKQGPSIGRHAGRPSVAPRMQALATAAIHPSLAGPNAAHPNTPAATQPATPVVIAFSQAMNDLKASKHGCGHGTGGERGSFGGSRGSFILPPPCAEIKPKGSEDDSGLESTYENGFSVPGSSKINS